MADLSGIKRAAHGGWLIWVRVRPLAPQQRSLPAGTTQRQAIEVRDALKAELRQRRNLAERAAPTAGTFAADVERYLKAVRSMPSYADRKWMMTFWVTAFGKRHRRDITAADIRTALAAWSTDYSPRTLNHLRGALMHLWHVLDGRAATNPVRDVPAARTPDDMPRNLPPDAVEAILSEIAPSKARAVLRVMAATGMTPTEISRIEPADILPDALIARGRRKGKGTRPRTLPLTPDGRAALEEFRQADAWGGVSLRTIGAAWRLAKRKAGYGHTDWRAYDLRHTVLTEYASEGDDRVVQYIGGHSTPKMTQRYTLGSVPDRVASVVATVVAKRSVRPRTVADSSRKNETNESAASGPKTGENARSSRVRRGER